MQDAHCLSNLIGNLILLTQKPDETKRCPGLNQDDVSFLNVFGRQDVWDPSSSGGLHLVETKARSLKFIASGAFIDSERFRPAFLASADPNSRLLDIAEDILKRTLPATSFEDKALIESFLKLYLGGSSNYGAAPAAPPLRIKILDFLCKSTSISDFIPQVLEIVHQGLSATQSTDQMVIRPRLESSKLISRIFALISWLIRVGSTADIVHCAEHLSSEVIAHIDAQGWPVPSVKGDSKATSSQLQSRNSAYETVGTLMAVESHKAANLPLILISVKWLFDSLSCDSSGLETSASVEHALSSILGTLRLELDLGAAQDLSGLLAEHMRRRVGDKIFLNHRSAKGHFEVLRSTRSVAVRFANRALPFQDIRARWIDIVALDGGPSERQDVIDEAHRGLDPFWHQSLTSRLDTTETKVTFPDFCELTDAFFGSNSTISHVPAFETATGFAQSILIHQALADRQQSLPAMDTSWDRNLETAIQIDEGKRTIFSTYLRKKINDRPFRGALLTFLIACGHAFRGLNHNVAGRCGQILLNILLACPAEISVDMADSSPFLSHRDYPKDFALKIVAAEVFGILASYSQGNAIQVETKALHESVGNLQQARIIQSDHTCGALLALAFLKSRGTLRRTNDESSQPRQSQLITAIKDIISDSKDKITKNAAVLALGELALFGVIPRTSTLNDPMSGQVDDIWQKGVLQNLFEMSKAGDEMTINTLGFLASRCDQKESEETEDDALSHLFTMLYDLHEIRQPEVHFAVGAAMSCAAIGWQSMSLIAKLNVEGQPPQLDDERQAYLSEVLDKVLSACGNTKPALRQASVIWLLCLVQYCGHHQLLHARLRQCQEAFKSFLADRESLNQETAARGLSLCYEKGDRELKDDLIRDLVTSFMGTKKSDFGKISADTQLFEPGALPTGDGQSVTTYKDILSLASEVGDPSLVYRFMSLATNNSIWSSRAAFGRFGLSTILSDSSVDGYLAKNPKLYSSLFRYRFDPNQNVKTSMNDIWNALVKDSSAVIASNFDNILQDLLKNILGKEWRNRQASCTAIANLLQGQKFEKYEKYLLEIWQSALKVSDDIKESVQLAGLDLCKTLIGILTRSLQASSSSSGEAPISSPAARQLQVVFSFIFGPTGIESRSEIVQSFSLWALLEVIKSSSHVTLRPFVSDIVGHLLGLLSASEPMVANYLRQRADQHGTTAQDVDDVRIRLIRDSPLMEAVERSLDTIDAESMEPLTQSLENAMKTVVGLPSKVGTSRVLVSLSTRHNYVFKPFADRFLRLATGQLLDINDTVSAAFATACGYLARLASDQEILRVVQYCRKLYFETDDQRHRSIAGDVLYAISKYATDRFNSLSSSIIPLIFVAKHDLDHRTKSSFKNAWDENVGGSRSVLLYFQEIVALISPQLASPQWSVKHTSSLALANAITATGSNLSDNDTQVAWPVLDEALKSKTWAGKEEVLRSFISFIKNGKALSDDGQAKQVRKIMFREAKRNNTEYRVHSLACLADFCKLDKDEDHFPQVLQIVEPLLENLEADPREMDVDSKTNGPSSRAVAELIQTNAASALLAAINTTTNVSTEAGLKVVLEQSQSLLTRAMLPTASSKLQNAVMEELGELFKRLHSRADMNSALQQVLMPYVIIVFMPEVERVEQTRSIAADVAEHLARLAGSTGSDVLRERLRVAVEHARQEERSIPVQRKLEQALDTMKA